MSVCVPHMHVFCRTEITAHLIQEANFGIFLVNDYCAAVLQVTLPVHYPMGNINLESFALRRQQTKMRFL